MSTNTADDAGVYRLSDDIALVQTVDFFPPVVDDPYSFGAIAAANAVSDIYAMGARPLVALNLVCFPAQGLPLSVLTDILRGGADKAAEAGFSIVGGHTLDDKEPKYGLAVTGIVSPGKQVTNSAAKVGGELILTKPLGIGIITTGMKAAMVSEEAIERAIAVMSALNRKPCELMLQVGVNACTDVTGFGLLGHLYEMTVASGVGARVSLSQVPVLEEAWDLVKEGIVPGGTYKNLRFLEKAILWDSAITEEAKLVLCDAQTSGGLLISMPKGKGEELLAALRQAGIAAARIGEVIEDRESRIQVVP